VSETAIFEIDMQKLSAVVITFNEEKKIAGCLDSLINIADEVVVVDSFSTDNTEAICRAYKVNFSQHKFDGHIEQKNYAISLAKYDFILSLDADERLSDKLLSEIRKVKGNFSFDAYQMNRLTNYCGKFIRHSGWYPDSKIRLFNRRKCKWGGTNPHDKIVIEPDVKVSILQGDILHFSYDSIQSHIKQMNSFTEIGAQQLFDKGKRAGIFDLTIRPFWKFFRDYIIKLGFLDGYYGYVVCMLSAVHVFSKYAKLKQMQLQREKNK